MTDGTGAPPLAAADDAAVIAALRAPTSTYWLTRFVFLRALGFIYSVAFLILHDQMLPLFGSHGLLPAPLWMAELHQYETFWRYPTLFWFDVSDRALMLAANLGLGLSVLVMAGLENALVMGVLWALYLSFVHVGQLFYGYGWETLLLETGFLAIFLCPFKHVLPLRDPSAAPLPVMILLRWLLLRLMLGAGLIKLRGDACWRDLSCLVYHYETQPVPHAISWLLHQAPRWFHQVGTAFNHFVELIVPLFLLAPRRWRHLAAALVIVFQSVLILSGNLSFLNWLTIVIALACFDDRAWGKLLPAYFRRRSHQLQTERRDNRARSWVSAALAVLVAGLSISPVLNMLSPRQRMNTSFEPLHLVNSYGAFGSIGRIRDEIILEGTLDPTPDASARWAPYEFKCKPGDVHRTPCFITPYHYRLDWQMWFAAMSTYDREPWLVHFIYKLLQQDRGALSLLAHSPFTSGPPRYIRAERYRYRFTHFGSQDYWSRERIGSYLPALSREDPRLRRFLEQNGLLPEAGP